MSVEKVKPQLPSGPPTLCFDKDEFTKENFSIDRFVSDCCKHVHLEKLREDLGLYLRLLRTAMIELINQDYADFVNLSSNLVGLDKSINNLSVPLGQLREEIKSVKEALDDGLHVIESKLEHRKMIRDKKVCLQHLMSSVSCVERIENLLRIDVPNGEIGIKGELMERVASEFNQLQFVTSKVAGLPLIEKMKPRIDHITNIVQRNLETAFLNSLKTENKSSVTQCLRIYSTIDRISEAEDLFRKKVVAPYLENVVNEETLRLPGGMKLLFKKVLEFIPKHCGLLRSLQDSKFNYEPICGFDFLVNSVWPEIVTIFEIRIPSIFDLTNPDAFHERYITAEEFVDGFEKELESAESLTNFRFHPSYNIFMNKWNLPVYFQIRFQEIAGTLESSLISEITKTDHSDKEFNLSQTNVLWECLHNCWSSQVLLQPLAHRFWKLSILLFARFNTWLTDSFLTKFSQEILQENVNDSNREKIGVPNGVSNSSTTDKLPIVFLVYLTGDVYNLLDKLDHFVQSTVISCMLKSGIKDVDDINECSAEVKTKLGEILPKVNDVVSGAICSQCIPALKSVYDIPRLYRKTNREVPTKPSAYVSSCVKPLESFIEQHKSIILPVCEESWIRLVITEITLQYLNVTSEVITSVKKMEDSLKRLKKIREKLTQSNNSVGMSDDDKIRLQLSLDVQYYSKQVTSMSAEMSSNPSLNRLIELVESVRSSPAPS
ncbi:Conserved oligomeric Golgi complex subunit 2 [Chamberlinius hualienensis]